MSNINLTDKVAVITGSGSGIGATVALNLAKLGARVALVDRVKDKLESIANQCSHVSPVKEKSVHHVVADLTNDDECKQLIRSVIEYFGKIDILINNAGVASKTPISEPNIMKLYDYTMNINVRSAFYITHLTVPYLEKTKGVIINLASVLALRPSPPLTVYCMSKSAIEMFTKCLAIELGPKGIRVNSVNPGVTKTPLFTNTLGMDEESVEKNIYDVHAKGNPLRRVGVPQDIANAIVFLASDNASFINGANIVVDGGELWSFPAIE